MTLQNFLHFRSLFRSITMVGVFTDKFRSWNNFGVDCCSLGWKINKRSSLK